MSKRGKRRSRPRSRPSEGNRKRSRPNDRQSLEKPSTRLIDNNKLRILLAILAVLGGGYLYSSKDCNKSDSGKGVEKVQSPRNLVEGLRPYIQSQFVLPKSNQQFDNLKSRFYPLSLNVEAWIRQLRKVAEKGFNHATPEEKKLVRRIIEDILKSGIFEELKQLRQANEREASQKKISISLVPIEHWDPKTGQMTEDGIACARDVAAMVRAIRKFSPKSKFFIEGIDIKELITEESILQSVFLMQGGEAKGLQIIRQYYPWVLDGQSQVYGLENGKFFQTYTQYMDSANFRSNVSSNTIKVLFILFQSLLREQLAIERAISKLKNGESGYIFYGASHIIGMSHYINDRYKENVKHGALVPKHLIIRGK